ncbi:MAG: hypothetical protein AB3N23_17610 [Paracoccaceae bacterium]
MPGLERQRFLEGRSLSADHVLALQFQMKRRVICYLFVPQVFE